MSRPMATPSCRCVGCANRRAGNHPAPSQRATARLLTGRRWLLHGLAGREAARAQTQALAAADPLGPSWTPPPRNWRTRVPRRPATTLRDRKSMIRTCSAAPFVAKPLVKGGACRPQIRPKSYPSPTWCGPDTSLSAIAMSALHRRDDDHPADGVDVDHEPYQKLGPPPASLLVTHTVARVSDKAPCRRTSACRRG